MRQSLARTIPAFSSAMKTGQFPWQFQHMTSRVFLPAICVFVTDSPSYTQDESFLVSKAWPLLKELALFWEDNLEWEDGNARWVIRDSGAREGGQDTNAITDLAYVGSLFQFLVDTADLLEGKKSAGETIHIAAEQKQKWRSYVKDLSKFPTIVIAGKTVFKEAENRNRMSLGGPGDNSDVLNHVFPVEATRAARHDPLPVLNDPVPGRPSLYNIQS